MDAVLVDILLLLAAVFSLITLDIPALQTGFYCLTIDPIVGSFFFSP